jgi:predicted nucleic acid-binding protein
MDSVLLDTDVFSYLFKQDSRASLYADDMRDKRLCLSFMTVAELRFWQVKWNWGAAKRERLAQVLRHYVIIPYDDEMADRWAEIRVASQRAAREISCGDCWVAASALRHGLPLLSHNRRDFETVPNLRLISREPHSGLP